LAGQALKEGLRLFNLVILIMTSPLGYFNYGPTFTEVFSPSGGKFYNPETQ
jgi:hypothetical protein